MAASKRERERGEGTCRAEKGRSADLSRVRNR